MSFRCSHIICIVVFLDTMSREYLPQIVPVLTYSNNCGYGFGRLPIPIENELYLPSKWIPIMTYAWLCSSVASCFLWCSFLISLWIKSSIWLSVTLTTNSYTVHHSFADSFACLFAISFVLKPLSLDIYNNVTYYSPFEYGLVLSPS